MEYSYFDDFYKLFSDLANAKTSDDEDVYKPAYGGWGASELQANYYNTLFANYMNYAINRETNDTNLKLAKQQNEWNLAQWNRENAYNDPSAQASRLRSAGLSSAAAAQAVSPNMASPLQSANLANAVDPASMQVPQFGQNPLMQLLQTLGSVVDVNRNFVQLRKDRVEANVAEQTQQASVDNIVTQSDAQKVALKMALEDYQFKVRTNPYAARSMMYKMQADSFLPEINRLTTQDFKLKLKTAREYYGWITKYHDKQLDEIQSVINKNIQEKNESESRVNVNKSVVGLNNATIANVHQDTANKVTEGKILTQDWVGKVVDNALKQFGSPDNPTMKFGALVASGVLPADKVGDFLKACKSYVESSGREFDSSTPALRDIFLYTLNPGAGQGANTPVWSHGTVTKPLDWIKGTIGRYTPWQQKPY